MKKGVIVLLHIGYWLTYLLLIFFIMLLMPHGGKRINFYAVAYNTFCSPFGVSTMASAALGFYLFYTVMFTRFLHRKKIVLLFVFGLLGVLGCGIVSYMLLNILFVHAIKVSDSWPAIIGVVIIMSVLSLLNGVIGLVMRGFISWYGDIKLKEDLNRRNYEMELALVKSQINPHFLFNTINNIDVLIEVDAAKASAYLNKLSDIMRFMLYETKTAQIPLAKELTYIEKYIDLQRIRNANPGHIKYNVQGEPGNIMIEPMLYIPFIENAFKHAVSKRDGTAVSIQFIIENNTVTFECENNYSTVAIKPEHSGLGNELITKRLQLLYPGRHTLTINNSNKLYTVKLVLFNHG